MTIKDLIEELKKYPEDMEVVIEDNHMEQGTILVYPSLKEDKVFKHTKKVMDAFDYTEYLVSIWNSQRSLDKDITPEETVLIIGKGNSKK